MAEIRRLEKQDGQSLVEFAVILPILLLILVGVIDLGRVFFYQVTITSAAREGVRAASVYTNNDADIRTAVRNEASSTVALADGNISITPTPARTQGQPVQVEVSYDFVAITPIIGSLLGNGPLRIRSSAAAVVQ